MFQAKLFFDICWELFEKKNKKKHPAAHSQGQLVFRVVCQTMMGLLYRNSVNHVLKFYQGQVILQQLSLSFYRPALCAGDRSLFSSPLHAQQGSNNFVNVYL